MKTWKNFPANGPKIFLLVSIIVLIVDSTFSQEENADAAGMDYVPKGTIEKLDGMDVYVYGSGAIPVIIFYDVFGMLPKVQMIADQLADHANNLKVIMPDFFRGEPYKLEDWGPTGPKDPEHFQKFLMEKGSWETVKPDFHKALKHFGTKESDKFGVIGFCWGGQPTIRSTKDFPHHVVVTAIFHPAGFGQNTTEIQLRESAMRVHAPMMVGPSKNEVDMTPFVDQLKMQLNTKEGDDNVAFNLFDTVNHGFGANRANLDDPEVVKQRGVLVELTNGFFKRIYDGLSSGSRESGDYKPKGAIKNVDGLDVYVYGKGKIPVIVFYDVFGILPKIQQTVDMLVDLENNFRILMPDFFRGEPYKLEDWGPTGPKDPEHFQKFLQEKGSWDTVKPDFQRVVKHLAPHGNKRFAVIGFCWGGQPTISATNDFKDNVVVTAIIHPAGFGPNTTEDKLREQAMRVKAPMFVGPTKNEVDMTPFVEQLKKQLNLRETDDFVGFNAFTTVNHGFGANRANLEDEEVVKQRGILVDLLNKFFARVYPLVTPSHKG